MYTNRSKFKLRNNNRNILPFIEQITKNTSVDYFMKNDLLINIYDGETYLEYLILVVLF